MSNSSSTNRGASTASFIGSYKFYPPLPLANAITRARLLAELRDDLDFTAAVIQGPAGHGKTTLMQQIVEHCRSRGVLVGWLTLEDSDNDISRFHTCLRNLVISADSDQRVFERDLEDRSVGDGAVEDILLLLDAFGGPVALFLDEFQEISESANIALLHSIIERSPPNITFYIGSRSIPSMAKGRMLISGQIKWITSEDLCFTTEEVADFLGSVDLKCSKEEIEAFRSQTGGWPAALQLLQLALRGGKINRGTLLAWVKGCQNELTEYLADNVMLDQTENRKSFLLRTSLLKRMSAPLCEAITGETKSRQILQEFVSQGLFIRSLDFKQRWFKYHSVFSSYLAESIAESDPDEVILIHKKAADWFREMGYPEEAIYHALEASEYELAADILCDWTPELIRSARLQTVAQLCSQMPDEVYETRPVLSWGRTWACQFLSDPATAKISLDKLRKLGASSGVPQEMYKSIQILTACEHYTRDHIQEFGKLIEKIEVDRGELPNTGYFEMGGLANLKALHALQSPNFPAAREHALMGESFGERGEAPFSGAYSSSIFAYAMIEEGHLAAAVKRLREGLSKPELKALGSLASASISAIYGYALYESGHYIEAENHLSDSIDLISKTLPVAFLIPAHLSLAKASALAESQSTDSKDVLDNAEKLGLTRELPRLVRAVRRERIRLAYVNNNCQEAGQLYNMPEVVVDDPLPRGLFHVADSCSDDSICEARIAICCGDINSTVDLLNEAIDHAEKFGWMRRKIKLLILQALVKQAEGKEKAAENTLCMALELAASRGYVALFVDEGERCTSLLLAILKDSAAKLDTETSEFIVRVLQSAGSDMEQLVSCGSDLKPYEKPTKRELDVVRLLVNGASNAEIADDLYVSRNTVKYHLKNLYSKLGAKNRVSLISIARRRELI
jgi:LuxR family maltose regulon positive regulatory protein